MSAKEKLLKAKRKVAKSLSIDVGGEQVPIEIRRPTFADRNAVIDGARSASDLDEKDQPKDPHASVRLLARVAACVVFDPETGARMFEESEIDEIAKSPWLEDLQADVMAVFNVKEETARGNSGAIPSSR